MSSLPKIFPAKEVVGDIRAGGKEISTASTDSLPTAANLAANPFLDPHVANHYRGLYEEAGYECRHVFDPELEWTPQEEKRLVDRSNLTQAVSSNMLEHLKLTTNQYNYGRTNFYVSFLLAEIPSQLVSKKIGPDRWIPIQMCLWSVVAAAQVGLTGQRSYYATRSLLSLLEGGFIPDSVLSMSYFYTSRELPVHLSFFWAALSVTGIITALLAFGLLHMDGIAGIAGWRWLFLIEGLLTLLIGFVSFFRMPTSAIQTKT